MPFFVYITLCNMNNDSAINMCLWTRVSNAYTSKRFMTFNGIIDNACLMRDVYIYSF